MPALPCTSTSSFYSTASLDEPHRTELRLTTAVIEDELPGEGTADWITQCHLLHCESEDKQLCLTSGTYCCCFSYTCRLTVDKLDGSPRKGNRLNSKIPGQLFAQRLLNEHANERLQLRSTYCCPYSTSGRAGMQGAGEIIYNFVSEVRVGRFHPVRQRRCRKTGEVSGGRRPDLAPRHPRRLWDWRFRENSAADRRAVFLRPRLS